MTQAIEGILTLAAENGIDIPPRAAGQFDRLIEALLLRGERLSLLSRRDLTAERIASRHITDALRGLLLAHPKREAKVLDFGAGSGILGFTWAVLRPDLQVTLLEAMGRKAFFLGGAAERLGLSSVEVWEGRGEDLLAEGKGEFDLLVSRGVATDRKRLAVMRKQLKPFGEILFFKGPETVSELRRLVKNDGKLSIVRERSVPLGEGKMRMFLQVSHVPTEGEP